MRVEDFFLKNATEIDIPGILDISKDVYLGNDYLPHVLDRWIWYGQEKPSLRSNVVLKRKDNLKVVAFESILWQNEGGSVMMQGFRVAPFYRGRGLVAIFRIHFRQYFMETILQRVTPCPFDNLAKLRLARDIDEKKPHYLKNISHIEMVQLLKLDKAFHELCVVSQDNIITHSILYHFDTLAREDFNQIHHSPIHILMGRIETSLSVLTLPYPSPNGYVGVIDIYATSCLIAKCHVIYQLRYLASLETYKHIRSNLILQIVFKSEYFQGIMSYLTEDLNMEEFHKVLKYQDGKPAANIAVVRESQIQNKL